MLLTELRERLVNFEFDNVVEYAKEFSDKYATQNFDVRDTIRKRSRILKIFISTLALPEIPLGPLNFLLQLCACLVQDELEKLSGCPDEPVSQRNAYSVLKC